MRKVYKTVRNETAIEMEERKSRFIASVKPVDSEEEAVLFIASMRSKYWDASHNVYGYFIGGESTTQRYSDDGEPAGTAGMPVIEAIKRTGVQDLVVVVTRYFGGTLLGAAGLIRAYGKSAVLGIEAALIIEKRLCREFRIIVEYSLYGRLQNVLISHGYTLADTIFGRDIEIKANVPVDEKERFRGLVEEITNARAILYPGSETYITTDA